MNEPAPDRADDAYAAVQAALYAVDPEGLVALGLPADEYDPEIRDLSRILRARGTLCESDVVIVWDHWFGSSSHLTRAHSREIIGRVRAAFLEPPAPEHTEGGPEQAKPWPSPDGRPTKYAE